MRRTMGPSRFPAAVVLFAFALSTAACATTQQPATLSGERIQAAVDSAHARWQDDTSGKNADYIPYLAHVPSELFGVVVVTADGRVYAHGDVDYGFSIQSVSKPFTAALVMQESGHEAVVEKVGVEPTGLPFNSIVAIEQLPARSVDPMVNAGAIAAVSLVPRSGGPRLRMATPSWTTLLGSRATLFTRATTRRSTWSTRSVRA